MPTAAAAITAVAIQPSAFSPGWSAFRHCDASENIRGWVEAHDWILDYDFNAVVCGHTNHWGTREDAQESRDYAFDMLEFSKEALNSNVDQDLFERFGRVTRVFLARDRETQRAKGFGKIANPGIRFSKIVFRCVPCYRRLEENRHLTRLCQSLAEGDAVHQRGRVDPCLAAVPALDAGGR